MRDSSREWRSGLASSYVLDLRTPTSTRIFTVSIPPHHSPCSQEFTTSSLIEMRTSATKNRRFGRQPIYILRVLKVDSPPNRSFINTTRKMSDSASDGSSSQDLPSEANLTSKTDEVASLINTKDAGFARKNLSTLCKQECSSTRLSNTVPLTSSRTTMPQAPRSSPPNQPFPSSEIQSGMLASTLSPKA